MNAVTGVRLWWLSRQRQSWMEYCTAQHSTALNEGNAWCWTRSFEAKIWHARSHAWIVAGNCTAGLCIKITKKLSSPSTVKASSTGLERPWGIQEVETPRFQDNNRHRKTTARLPALRTGPLYPPGNTPSTDFYSRLSRTQGHSTAGRFMLMKKNSCDTVGIRTRDLPDCSAEKSSRGPPKLLQTQVQWLPDKTGAVGKYVGYIPDGFECKRSCFLY